MGHWFKLQGEPGADFVVPSLMIRCLLDKICSHVVNK